jgi:hypothetical protein
LLVEEHLDGMGLDGKILKAPGSTYKAPELTYSILIIYPFFSREEMTVDEKVDQAMIAVGDETGMRDDVSGEESEEGESDDENQDDAAKQKRQLCKYFVMELGEQVPAFN